MFSRKKNQTLLVIMVLLTSNTNAQQNFTLEAQELLIERGYDPGTADGLIGPKTRSAIRQFQTEMGLAIDGAPNLETMQSLRFLTHPNSEIEVKELAPLAEPPSSEIVPLTTIEPPSMPPEMETPSVAKEENAEIIQPASATEKTSIQNIPLEEPKPAPTPVQPSENNTDEGMGWKSWAFIAFLLWLIFGRKKKPNKSTKHTNRSKTETSAKQPNYKPDVNFKVSGSYRPQTDENFTKLTWHSAGNTVKIAGRNITGLVYTGKPKKYEDRQNFMINPSLRVASKGHPADYRAMQYWPSYSDIDPKARATYLDWLASGRRAYEADVGYVFLFFYGLEYRFFCEAPNADEKVIILQEVKELLNVYGENNSVKRYLNNFIDFASLTMPRMEQTKPVFVRSGLEVPIIVQIALGAFTNAGKNIEAGWMLSWFITSPETRLRTPAKRCFEEFKAQFFCEFKEKYPDGYKLRKTKRKLQLIYQSASGGFQHTVGGKFSELPDFSTHTKPIDDMMALADSATEKLEKYSRFLGRNPEAKGSLEAQTLLPLQLREQFPSHEEENFRAWVISVIESGGLVPVDALLIKLSGQDPAKITKSLLTNAADSLAGMGFGLAPDPRFAMRAPKFDEPVVLFDLGKPIAQLEDVSDAYRNMLVQLALGAFIAHADGEFTKKEQDALRAYSANIEGLSDHEQRRLRANIHWFVAVPPDMSMLRRKLKSADEIETRNLRAAIIAIAVADGVIQAKEITNIEKTYKSMGLDPSLVYSDLHAGETSGGPVRVRSAQNSPAGEQIPIDGANQPIELNLDRIASIRADTNRVSEVLAAVFAEEETKVSGPERQQPEILKGLHDNYAVFALKIIERESWSEDDFNHLATQHGLMASGALETINEWAYDTFDDALLDAYEGVDVSEEIAAKIKSMRVKEVQ